MIDIDGSFHEGGGQILRTSLSLSCLTGQPVHIRKIRAGRKPPGLKAQHLAAVRAAAEICGATVEGDRKGSGELTFAPGPVRPGDYRFDIGTAGAAPLVLHTVVYPLAACESGSSVTITGGTHVPHAPNAPFLEHVWAWWYRRLGGQIELELERAGLFPKGGGVLHAQIEPAGESTLPETLERGALEAVELHSQVTTQLAEHVLERQLRGARQRLRGLPVVERPAWLESYSTGTAMVCVAQFAGGRGGATSLGKIGKRAETVGEEAATGLQALLDGGAPLDAHMADQLLLPAVLAGRPLRYPVGRVSGHLLTNADTIGRFLDVAIAVEGEEGEPGEVRIHSAA